MNSDQQNTLDRLAIEHGRTAVREGYVDQYIEVTVPSGRCFHVGQSGRVIKTTLDHSINWEVYS